MQKLESHENQEHSNFIISITSSPHSTKEKENWKFIYCVWRLTEKASRDEMTLDFLLNSHWGDTVHELICG